MTDPISAMAAAASEMRSLAAEAGGPAMTVPTPGVARVSGGSSFLAALTTALNRTDNTIASASGAAKAFAAGDRDISLSDVMVSLEEANLALQTAATVRDKVASAYTTIMNMQI